MSHAPGLWVFNYDFEFELSGVADRPKTQGVKTPFWQLNRAEALLLPLMEPGDFICGMAEAQPWWPKACQALGVEPKRLEIPLRYESHAMLDSLLQTRQSELPGFRLEAWGPSPKAACISQDYCTGGIDKKLAETARMVQSKAWTHQVRELLPPAMRIESQLIKGPISKLALAEKIALALDQMGPLMIKHPYGMAGRLLYPINEKKQIQGSLSLFLNWLSQAGEILLEKRMEIRRQWGLQWRFKKDGARQVALVAQVGGLGGYLGSVVDPAFALLATRLQKQLDPVAQALEAAGWQGPLGMDVIENNQGRFYLLECNARWSMGALALAWQQKLAPSQSGLLIWMIIPSTQRIKALEAEAALNSWAKKRGVQALPLVWAKLPDGARAGLGAFIHGDQKQSLWSQPEAALRELASLLV